MNSIRTLVLTCLFLAVSSLLTAWLEPVREVWEARYDTFFESYAETASALAIDGSGNVYVTGISSRPDQESSCVTVKYGPDGEMLWEAQLAGRSDVAAGIALDGTEGIYVTGTLYGTGWEDYATVKYDANGNEIWVATWGSNVLDSDRPAAIAADHMGNVYVTGYSDKDSSDHHLDYHYITVKYADDGSELWVGDYAWPGGEYDQAKDIAVDSEGNVFVTGWSAVEVTGSDFATVKYDSEGEELWVARYDGGTSGYGGEALALDGDGNVCVTGSTGPSYSALDYATVKYDTDGSELWVATYDGPSGSDDRAAAIAIDSDGSVYVTGASTGVGTGYDYATIKYDPDGNELWVARYHRPESMEDKAVGIAVSEAGLVYVTGKSYLSESSYDYLTLSYDPEGNLLWAKSFNGSANNEDAAAAIALSPEGYPVVTGYATDLIHDREFTTIRYDGEGNEEWVSTYDYSVAPYSGWDYVNDMAVDTEGNVIVAGYVTAWSTDYDWIIAMYDPSGSTIWTRRFIGPGGGEYERPSDVATALDLDGQGNIYVTGYSDGFSMQMENFLTIKYDSQGTEIWRAFYDWPESQSHDKAYDIAVDGDGNCYVVGSSHSQYILVSYDAAGDERWVASTDVYGSWPPTDITLDELRNVYVTGGEGTVKYDSLGNELWAVLLDESMQGIVVDHAGNVYVTGDESTRKYDSGGNEIWSLIHDASSFSDIALDPSGNVCITGTDGEALSTILLDPDGNELWESTYDSPAFSPDTGSRVIVDAQSDFYVTGRLGYYYAESTDWVTIKYDHSGKRRWLITYDGPAAGRDIPVGLALGPNRSVYVAGISTGLDTNTDMTVIKCSEQPIHNRVPFPEK
jgi:uncharacterized delta-60 repeat protein